MVADQFILFFEEKWNNGSIEAIKRINNGFIERQQRKYPEAKLRLRTGVYKVEKDCDGASFAIDAANYARRQIQDNSLRLYVYMIRPWRISRIWKMKLPLA